jgi:hypothetical protein
MREIRTSGSEGGGTGNSTGSSYPYRVTGIVEPHKRMHPHRWKESSSRHFGRHAPSAPRNDNIDEYVMLNEVKHLGF